MNDRDIEEDLDDIEEEVKPLLLNYFSFQKQNQFLHSLLYNGDIQQNTACKKITQIWLYVDKLFKQNQS